VLKDRRTWLIVAAVVIVPLLVVFLLARMTPSWYRPLDPNSQQVIDTQDIGEHTLVSGLHNTWQKVPLGDQLWSISQVEVNSVLAWQLAPPLNTDGTRSYPAGAKYPVVSDPFVMFEKGRVTIAARTTKLPGSAPGGGVVSVTFAVETIPGMAPGVANTLIRMEGAWVGNLRIPRSLVERKIRSMAPAILAGLNQSYRLSTGEPSKVMLHVEPVLHAIENGEPFYVKFPYMGREVVLKEIHLEDESLSVIFGPATPAAVRPRPEPVMGPGR